MPNQALNKAEKQGRRGDSLLGHLSPGDVIIPWNRVTPEVRDFLAQLIDVNRFTAGSEMNLLNPNTGLPEFAEGGGTEGGSGGNDGGVNDGGTDGGTGGTDTGGFDIGGYSNPGFDLSNTVDIGAGMGLGTGQAIGQEVAQGMGLGVDAGYNFGDFGSFGQPTTPISVQTTVPTPAPPPTYTIPFDLSQTVDIGRDLGLSNGNSFGQEIAQGMGLGFDGGYDFRGTALDPIYDKGVAATGGMFGPGLGTGPGGFFGPATEIGGLGGGNSAGGSELLSSNPPISPYLPNNPMLPVTPAYNPPLPTPMTPNIPDSLPDQGRYFATLAAGNNTAAANMLAPYLSGNRNIYGR